ncbi:Inositol phosphoceramide mannosyltransferase 3 [Colletotrichum sidae]|uniref:Inositol phosphoceramide mannosyltransferase 3 n=1 Tax=Colletotrichum sidae TaxID=1347389 RepID=A0A4R8TTX2_9PEZI|nr:Inositol phosphoceramide mannosyltransferase 3 [Colletotrichum sidae]
MVSLARGSCLKVLIAASATLAVVLVLHQVSYTTPSSFALTSQPVQVLKSCPPSPNSELLSYDVKPPPSSSSAADEPIPKIIHQLWKTTNISTYPSTPSHASWQTLLGPESYTVKLWTDESVLDLIRQNYTWLLSTYESYAHNIQRADVARLVVVHAEGGVYADLDVHPRSAAAVACLRQAQTQQQQQRQQNGNLQAIFAATGGNAGLSNHFFMAARGSDFLAWALREAKRRAGPPSRRILLPYLRVFWSTGPLMLTAAYQQYAWMYDDDGGGGGSPLVALLDETYARTVFGHAAGRSWHGSDGLFLNYVSDHVGTGGLWFGVPCLLAVVGLFCFVRRCRGERRSALELYRC